MDGLLELTPPIYLIVGLLDPENKPIYKTLFNANNIPPQQELKSFTLIFIYCLFKYENIIDFPKNLLYDN